MDAFEKKALRTSRGYTYTYYTSAGDKSLPALIFLHGWPDHAAMWADVAGPLRSLNYPIVVPDMLGYDGTDKPTDISAYRWDGMTKDLIEIIGAEQHEKVVSIGHDWGSVAASRLCQHYPNRVVGLINLNVAYTPLFRQPFDLNKMNDTTEKHFGYRIFSYWEVFTADDGAEIIDKNLERLYNAMHGQGETMKDLFCTTGALREYIINGSKDSINLRPYAQSPAFKSAFLSRFTRDSMTAPFNWYKANTTDVQYESDRVLPIAADKLDIPVLYIGATEDLVCRPETLIPIVQQGLLPRLEQAEMVEAAHWVTYENPGPVVESIRSWLNREFTR